MHRDTVDADGVAQAAAQQAATKAIGDLNADDLRIRMANTIDGWLDDVGVAIGHLQFDTNAAERALLDLRYKMRQAWNEVVQ